eukprot:454094-Rhodomonas_salina.1
MTCGTQSKKPIKELLDFIAKQPQGGGGKGKREKQTKAARPAKEDGDEEEGKAGESAPRQDKAAELKMPKKMSRRQQEAYRQVGKGVGLVWEGSGGAQEEEEEGDGEEGEEEEEEGQEGEGEEEEIRAGVLSGVLCLLRFQRSRLRWTARLELRVEGI